MTTTDILIYAGFGLLGAWSIRRLVLVRQQAERDHAAIERVRSLKLPPPREGERRYFASGSVDAVPDDGRRYYVPATDAQTATLDAVFRGDFEESNATWTPSSNDGFTGGGGDFGGGGAGGSLDSGSSSSSFD